MKAIRFTANWCGPCKAYAPIWNEVVQNRKDFEFEVVDIDENFDAASKYGIKSIPVTIIENNGEILTKYVGVLQKQDLNSKLDEWINS
jgi:thioredoxin 1